MAYGSMNVPIKTLIPSLSTRYIPCHSGLNQTILDLLSCFDFKYLHPAIVPGRNSSHEHEINNSSFFYLSIGIAMRKKHPPRKKASVRLMSTPIACCFCRENRQEHKVCIERFHVFAQG